MQNKLSSIVIVAILSLAAIIRLSFWNYQDSNQLSVVTTASNGASSKDGAIFKEYVNPTYHFALSFPIDLHLPGCTSGEPIKVSHYGLAATIGTYFTACPA